VITYEFDEVHPCFDNALGSILSIFGNKRPETLFPFSTQFLLQKKHLNLINYQIITSADAASDAMHTVTPCISITFVRSNAKHARDKCNA